MRTKTPKQIHEQTMRILNMLAKEQARWDGRIYLGLTAKGKARAFRVRSVCWRYIDNIYASNGIKDRRAGNRIWETAGYYIQIASGGLNENGKRWRDDSEEILFWY